MPTDARLDELQDLIIRIAPSVDRFLNPLPTKLVGDAKVGFILCVFDFDAGDAGDQVTAGSPVAYITNARHEQIAAALAELIEKLPKTARNVRIADDGTVVP